MLPTEEAPRGTLGTVRNATVLLTLLSEGPAFQQLTELAERSGMSLPTVHRLLRSLMVAGLVVQDTSSLRYGLGAEVVRLAEHYLDRWPVLRVAGPFMVDLRNRTSATILLAKLIGDTVVYVDRVDAPSVEVLFRRAHHPQRAVDAAAGRLLLGQRAAADLSTAPFEDEAAGWSDREWVALRPDDAQVLELAAPISDRHGHPLAAIVAVATLDGRSEQDAIDELLPALRKSADAITQVMRDG